MDFGTDRSEDRSDRHFCWPMAFKISGSYQPINHPGHCGQYISVSLIYRIIADEKRDCLDVISVWSFWEWSRVVWLMLSLWFMKADWSIWCVRVWWRGKTHVLVYKAGIWFDFTQGWVQAWWIPVSNKEIHSTFVK